MVFVKVGPNTVLVVSGCCLGKPLKISKGGSKWVCSGVQKYQKLSLNVKTILIVSPRIYTKLGVPITVTGVSQIKVESRHEDMLEAAIQQFLSYSEGRVIDTVRETLEAHQRAIMGVMTVEEIYQDRKRFSEEVFRVASADLVHMGITVVSYTIKDVSDEQGYLLALGQKRTAEVIRDARTGEAEAKRDSETKKAQAEKTMMTAKLDFNTQIAKAEKDYLMKKAEYDKEVKSVDAIAKMAYQLQEAKTRQKIMEEERQVDVIERERQTEVQELEVIRIEKQLEAQVKKSAEAEKARIEVLARAEKVRLIRMAEAQAESVKLKGEAEAFATEVIGKADAEQLTLKAEAYESYPKAAKIEMVLDVLPRVASEVAQPLTQTCKKITMIANGDAAELGISKLTGEILSVVQSVHTLVNGVGQGDTSLSLAIRPQRSV